MCEFLLHKSQPAVPPLLLCPRHSLQSYSVLPAGPAHPPTTSTKNSQIKVTSLSQQNSRLVSHVALVEGQKAMLAQQVGGLGGWVGAVGPEGMA